MSDIIQHKKGATFLLECQWTEGGVAVDLTGDTLTCQMENSKFSFDFTVDMIYEVSGEFEIRATAAEALTFLVGSYSCDIKRTTAAGEVYPTKTFTIKIGTKVT